MNDFNEYQEKSKKLCLKEAYNLLYLGLGLTSEAGEVAGKLKKIVRDYGGFDKMTPDKKEGVMFELGDVLWYIAVIAEYLGYNLDYVAEKNYEKLVDRLNRNKIHGEGDYR